MMASCKVISILRALVVVAVAGMHAAGAESAHFEVMIKNKLGVEEMNIAECTYKRQLGTYPVANGEEVKWNLLIADDQPFECKFYWQNKYMEGPLFSLSKQGKKCTNNKCNWELRPDGIYFLAEGNPKGERILEWKE